MLFFHFVSNFIPEERLRARFHGFLHRVLTPSAVNKSP
jgi:ribosomal protein L34